MVSIFFEFMNIVGCRSNVAREIPIWDPCFNRTNCKDVTLSKGRKEGGRNRSNALFCLFQTPSWKKGVNAHFPFSDLHFSSLNCNKNLYFFVKMIYSISHTNFHCRVFCLFLNCIWFSVRLNHCKQEQ